MSTKTSSGGASLMPTDRQRGALSDGSQHACVRRLEPELTRRLRAVANAAQASVDACLIAVGAALVHRYTRGEMVALAARTATRTHSLVLAMDDDPSLTVLTGRVEAALAGHHSAESDDDRGVLISTGGASVVPARSELSINARVQGDDIVLEVMADAALFEAATCERFATLLARLSHASCADPATPLAQLDLLDANERAAALEPSAPVIWQGEQVMHRLVESQVLRTPCAVAVEFCGYSLTYEQLNVYANLLARTLVEKGIGPGTLVSICFERSLELLVAMLAIHKAGAAFLPIDPDLPRERIRYQLVDAASTLMLVHESLVAEAREFVHDLPVEVLVYTVSTVDTASGDTTNLPDRVTPEQLAYILYTSGSTGRPKGVELVHRALCNHAQWFARRLGMTGDDRMLQHASIGFDAALPECFAPLTVGATVVLLPPKVHRDLLAFPRTVVAERITVAQLVPSALRVIVGSDGFAECRTLRYLVCGGEALESALARAALRALPHLRLGNFYGPTEATVDASSFEVTEASLLRQHIPIGTPIANAWCRILDERQQLVASGLPGELYVGGTGLARGYRNLPERTDARFVDDPFTPGQRLYRTGDLVRALSDGNIEFIGRVDTQVKLRGHRIELREIEMALMAQPAIRDAVVVLRDVAPEDPHLVAYVVPCVPASIAIGEVRAALRSSLPGYMVPARFVLLDALPVLQNGKIDRRALPEPMEHEPPAPLSLALADPLERSLQAIWERTLGVAHVGADDEFFALGGHSLKAIRVLAEIEREHGIALRAATLFDAPTVRALAAWIRDAAPRADSTLVPVQRGGTRTPLFFVPGAGGELFVFEALARALGPDQPLFVLDMYVFGDARSADHGPITLADVAERMIGDMRAVQPKGPYQLAGYSLGGNIVFEMAQQLRRAGDAVHLLALLDCDGPDYPHVQPFLARTVRHVQHARTLPTRNAIAYLATRVGKLGRFFGVREDDVHLYADQEEASMVPAHIIDGLERALAPVLTAWDAYVPRFYGGPVLLVRADVRRRMIGVIDDDPLLGWGPVVGGLLGVERIACSHFDILRPEFAASLAAILTPWFLSEGGVYRSRSTTPVSEVSVTAGD